MYAIYHVNSSHNKSRRTILVSDKDFKTSNKIKRGTFHNDKGFNSTQNPKTLNIYIHLTTFLYMNQKSANKRVK